MNGDMIFGIVAAGAWLILAVSALASYRLSWGKMITLALVWAAIFAAMVIAVEWFQQSDPAAAPAAYFT